jgi:hypothetical protein
LSEIEEKKAVKCYVVNHGLLKEILKIAISLKNMRISGCVFF